MQGHRVGSLGVVDFAGKGAGFAGLGVHIRPVPVFENFLRQRLIGLRVPADGPGHFRHGAGVVIINRVPQKGIVRAHVRGQPVAQGADVVQQAGHALALQEIHVPGHGGEVFFDDAPVAILTVQFVSHQHAGAAPFDAAEAAAHRRDVRKPAVGQLTIPGAFQIPPQKAVYVRVVNRRGAEDLRVPGPAHALVALGAVRGNGEEIGILAPADVAVELIYHCIGGANIAGEMGDGGKHPALHVLHGRRFRHPGDFHIAIAVEGVPGGIGHGRVVFKDISVNGQRVPVIFRENHALVAGVFRQGGVEHLAVTDNRLRAGSPPEGDLRHAHHVLSHVVDEYALAGFQPGLSRERQNLLHRGAHRGLQLRLVRGGQRPAHAAFRLQFGEVHRGHLHRRPPAGLRILQTRVVMLAVEPARETHRAVVSHLPGAGLRHQGFLPAVFIFADQHHQKALPVAPVIVIHQREGLALVPPSGGKLHLQGVVAAHEQARHVVYLILQVLVILARAGLELPVGQGRAVEAGFVDPPGGGVQPGPLQPGLHGKFPLQNGNASVRKIRGAFRVADHQPVAFHPLFEGAGGARFDPGQRGPGGPQIGDGVFQNFRLALGKEAAFAQQGIGGQVVVAPGIQLPGHDDEIRCAGALHKRRRFLFDFVHPNAVQIGIGVVAGDLDAQVMGGVGVKIRQRHLTQGRIRPVVGGIAHPVDFQPAFPGDAIFDVIFPRQTVIVFILIQQPGVVFAEDHAGGLALHAEVQVDGEDGLGPGGQPRLPVANPLGAPPGGDGRIHQARFKGGFRLRGRRSRIGDHLPLIFRPGQQRLPRVFNPLGFGGFHQAAVPKNFSFPGYRYPVSPLQNVSVLRIYAPAEPGPRFVQSQGPGGQLRGQVRQGVTHILVPPGVFVLLFYHRMPEMYNLNRKTC